MGLDGMGLKHLGILFVASFFAGIFIVLIDGVVIAPVERALLTSQTVTPA